MVRLSLTPCKGHGTMSNHKIIESMRVLQFRTQEEYDEWLNNNELFQCYDKDMNLLGDILGTDADVLVSFGLAEINMTYRFCQIKNELTEKQLEELNKSRLVKVVVTDDMFQFTLPQKVIIKRLKKNFEEARKVGLIAFSSDEYNKMFFINGNAFSGITTDDNLSGEWKENDLGGHEFVKYTEEYLSQFVQIDTDRDCLSIDGDRQIDFVSYGCCGLPMFAQLKL